MKKVTTLILALVLCLSLIPATTGRLTASAYGNEYIQLEKSNFDPNEVIDFDYSGYLSEITEEDYNVLRIFFKTASGDYEEGESRALTLDETTSWLIAPAESGDYQLRIVRVSPPDYEDVYISTIPFTVGEVANEGTISTNKAIYAPGDEIIATVRRGSVDLDIVGLWKPGEEYIEGLLLVTLEGGSQVVEGSLYAPLEKGYYEARLYDVNGSLVASVLFIVSGEPLTSKWTQEQDITDKAVHYGLIPGSLMGEDWTRYITRAEFAAVSVRLYENLTGNTASPASESTFSDTSDPDVLKAYNIGAVNGMPDGRFAPDSNLTREQMATMLTRVLKSAFIEGWSLETDAQYTLNFTQPAPFVDDADISDYARTSVYFMVAYEIITGMPGNLFAPRAATPAQQAANYAVATREQALAISVRIVENLKNKPLEYDTL